MLFGIRFVRFLELFEFLRQLFLVRFFLSVFIRPGERLRLPLKEQVFVFGLVCRFLGFFGGFLLRFVRHFLGNLVKNRAVGSNDIVIILLDLTAKTGKKIREGFFLLDLFKGLLVRILGGYFLVLFGFGDLFFQRLFIRILRKILFQKILNIQFAVVAGFLTAIFVLCGIEFCTHSQHIQSSKFCFIIQKVDYKRCIRAAWQRMTEAAVETFKEFTFPYIGMDTIKSLRSRTSRLTPSPSLPKTTAAPTFQSVS